MAAFKLFTLHPSPFTLHRIQLFRPEMIVFRCEPAIAPGRKKRKERTKRGKDLKQEPLLRSEEYKKHIQCDHTDINSHQVVFRNRNHVSIIAQPGKSGNFFFLSKSHVIHAGRKSKGMKLLLRKIIHTKINHSHKGKDCSDAHTEQSFVNLICD